MSPRPVARIVRARLVPPDQGDLFGAGPELVREALQAGAREPRRGRIWHLGRIEEVDGHLYGRLGFEQRLPTARWQEEAQEFAADSIDWGAAAPFAIRLADLVVVYQPRKQDIRSSSFAAALRSILRLGERGAEWRIEPVAGRRLSFADWSGSMSVVTRVRVHVERGDVPALYRSDTVRKLVGARPDWVAVEWQADGGLDPTDPLVEEVMAQVEAGVGAAVADGRRNDSIRSQRRWDSVLGDEIVMTEIDLGGGGSEVDRDALREELATVELRAA